VRHPFHVARPPLNLAQRALEMATGYQTTIGIADGRFQGRQLRDTDDTGKARTRTMVREQGKIVAMSFL
jgi:hypothetical protein